MFSSFLNKQWLARVGVAGAALAAIAGCNGSFEGSGHMASTVSGDASFSFRVVCDVATQVVTGEVNYSDATAGIDISGTASGAALVNTPIGSVPAECDDDPDQGLYVGSYGSGADAGTFQVAVLANSACTATGYSFGISVTGGPDTGYENLGCPTDGYIRPLTQTSQTISFSDLGNVRFGHAPLTLAATASSGLPVSFSSPDASVCTISGTTLTVVGAGDCTVTATQLGNGTYAPAVPVTRVLHVLKAGATLVAQPISMTALTSGRPVWMVASLASSVTGLPLESAPITFSVRGVPACTNVLTNANGVAYCPVSRTIKAYLTHYRSYTSSYAGADNFLATATGGLMRA